MFTLSRDRLNLSYNGVSYTRKTVFIPKRDQVLSESFMMVLYYIKRLVSQTRAPLAACCQPAENFNRLREVLYVYEHKTQYILIHAPYTHIV